MDYALVGRVVVDFLWDRLVELDDLRSLLFEPCPGFPPGVVCALDLVERDQILDEVPDLSFVATCRKQGSQDVGEVHEVGRVNLVSVSQRDQLLYQFVSLVEYLGQAVDDLLKHGLFCVFVSET